MPPRHDTDEQDRAAGRSRRTVLAAFDALAAGAGCSETADTGSPEPSPTDAPTPTPTAGTPATPDGNRATRTPREPEPLDASGAWRQRGGGPGVAGATDASGVPEQGRAYWHLLRLRSGPAVVANGRLFHYSEIGVDADEVPTVTPTREAPSTARPEFSTEPRLVARDASTGAVAWSQPVAGYSRGWPATADGSVVAAVRGQLSVRERWSRSVGEGTRGDPVVVGETVLCPGGYRTDRASNDKLPGVGAFSLADGTTRWTAALPYDAGTLAADTASETVIALSWDYEGEATVLGLSRADGTERWRRAVSGEFFEGPAVAAGGPALIANGNGRVVALAPGTGATRWSRELPRVDGLAVGPERCYVATDEGLFALATADGTTRWSIGTAGRGSRFTPPAVADGIVYAGTGPVDGAYVAAYDAADGTERWRVGLPETVVGGDMVTAGLAAQPAVVDGAVYAFAKDGLYAFGPA